jgi:hypothetical protein
MVYLDQISMQILADMLEKIHIHMQWLQQHGIFTLWFLICYECWNRDPASLQRNHQEKWDWMKRSNEWKLNNYSMYSTSILSTRVVMVSALSLPWHFEFNLHVCHSQPELSLSLNWVTKDTMNTMYIHSMPKWASVCSTFPKALGYKGIACSRFETQHAADCHTVTFNGTSCADPSSS